ncbi:MAG: outer membrane protein assembly factor BamE [Verrucomicrobiota bacterium]
MKKFILCTAVSLVLMGCGGGSPLTLTQDNLNKVHDDMSQADVRSILGAPTESRTDPIPVVGGTQTTYVYRNDKTEVTIVFKNDQVKEKHGAFDQQ